VRVFGEGVETRKAGGIIRGSNSGATANTANVHGAAVASWKNTRYINNEIPGNAAVTADANSNVSGSGWN
jgi:hypothetical protein